MAIMNKAKYYNFCNYSLSKHVIKQKKGNKITDIRKVLNFFTLIMGQIPFRTHYGRGLDQNLRHLAGNTKGRMVVCTTLTGKMICYFSLSLFVVLLII